MLSIIVVAVVVASTLCLTGVDSVAVPGCTWQGKSYAEGEHFDPDPCTSCHCTGGRPMCAMMACRMPECVDSVQHPDQRCPTCPNGKNCRAPDGTVIPDGQTVSIGSSATCRCEHSHFFMSTDAVCQHTVS